MARVNTAENTDSTSDPSDASGPADASTVKPTPTPSTPGGGISIVKAAVLVLGAIVAAYVFKPGSSGSSSTSSASAAVNTTVLDTQVIKDTAHCGNLFYYKSNGDIFTACQDSTKTRQNWFPPYGRDDSPSTAMQGSIRSINTQTMKSRKLHFEKFSGKFAPGNIDVYEDEKYQSQEKDRNRAVYIYAINYLPNPYYDESNGTPKVAPQIEIFYHVVNSSTIKYLRSVKHSSLSMPLDVYVESPLSIYVSNLNLKTNQHSILHIRLSQIATVNKATVGVQVAHAPTKIQNTMKLSRGNHFSELLVSNPETGTLTRGSYIYGSVDDKSIEVLDDITFGSPIGSATYFNDIYAADAPSKKKRDASAYIIPSFSKARDLSSGKKAKDANSLTVWMARPRGKAKRSEPWTKTGKWEQKVLFNDDGSKVKSMSSAVLVPIDPKSQRGKKRAWLYMTGNFAPSVIAVKVAI